MADSVAQELNMIEQVVTEYKFTYRHVNHSVFKGVIRATSIKNRDVQMLSLLYGRYRRHLTLDGVVFEEVV
jgi:hypothetical protein